MIAHLLTMCDAKSSKELLSEFVNVINVHYRRICVNTTFTLTRVDKSVLSWKKWIFNLSKVLCNMVNYNSKVSQLYSVYVIDSVYKILTFLKTVIYPKISEFRVMSHASGHCETWNNISLQTYSTSCCKYRKLETNNECVMNVTCGYTTALLGYINLFRIFNTSSTGLRLVKSHYNSNKLCEHQSTWLDSTDVLGPSQEKFGVDENSNYSPLIARNSTSTLDLQNNKNSYSSSGTTRNNCGKLGQRRRRNSFVSAKNKCDYQASSRLLGYLLLVLLTGQAMSLPAVIRIGEYNGDIYFPLLSFTLIVGSASFQINDGCLVRFFSLLYAVNNSIVYTMFYFI